MEKLLDDVHIVATDLPDAWFQTVFQCLAHGGDFKIDRGSFKGDKRLEFDYIDIHIINPGYNSEADINRLLPHLAEGQTIPNPVEDGYLDDYLSTYLMGSELAPDESYTYGQRLTKYEIPLDWQELYRMNKLQSPDKKDWREILIQEKEYWEDPKIIINEGSKSYVNQNELLTRVYKEKGYRNNQMVLQVAHPSDMLLIDPPCLREIDTRIQTAKDGKTYLHFFPEFRSWDLWGGFPANLGGIELLKQLVAGEIGVESGSIIARSKGLHLYSYVWELAEAIANKTIDEARKQLMG